MSAFKITNSRFPPTNYSGGVLSHADNATFLAKETPTEKEPKHPETSMINATVGERGRPL